MRTPSPSRMKRSTPVTPGRSRTLSTSITARSPTSMPIRSGIVRGHVEDRVGEHVRPVAREPMRRLRGQPDHLPVGVELRRRPRARGAARACFASRARRRRRRARRVLAVVLGEPHRRLRRLRGLGGAGPGPAEDHLPEKAAHGLRSLSPRRPASGRPRCRLARIAPWARPDFSARSRPRVWTPPRPEGTRLPRRVPRKRREVQAMRSVGRAIPRGPTGRATAPGGRRGPACARPERRR